MSIRNGEVGNYPGGGSRKGGMATAEQRDAAQTRKVATAALRDAKGNRKMAARVLRGQAAPDSGNP